MVYALVGDDAATNPKVLRADDLPEADDRLVNEVFGFVMRCATNSGAHLTDYFIARSATRLFGGPRAPELCEIAARCGYWTAHTTDDGHTGYLLADEPTFIHLRLKSEVEWDRQRKRDNANPKLTALVRLRDGDACRYCGRSVNFTHRNKGRAGTYDHNPPGVAATVDTMFVACWSCNSGRRDHPHRDQAYPLRPEPDRPLYLPNTVPWLETHGHTVEPTDPDSPLWRQLQRAHALPPALSQTADIPAPRPDRKPAAGPRPENTRPANPADTATHPRPEPSSDTATVRQAPRPPARPPRSTGDLQIASARSADPVAPVSKHAGSGREGPVRGGAGQVGSGRRAKRARRGGPTRSTSSPHNQPREGRTT